MRLFGLVVLMLMLVVLAPVAAFAQGGWCVGYYWDPFALIWVPYMYPC